MADVDVATCMSHVTVRRRTGQSPAIVIIKMQKAIRPGIELAFGTSSPGLSNPVSVQADWGHFLLAGHGQSETRANFSNFYGTRVPASSGRY